MLTGWSSKPRPELLARGSPFCIARPEPGGRPGCSATPPPEGNLRGRPAAPGRAMAEMEGGSVWRPAEICEFFVYYYFWE